MACEVLLDLALGFREERKIPAVAEQAGGGADGERARIPQGIQQARPATELADTLGAPREMVLFLARGLRERLARLRAPGDQRLSLVKRLGTDLAYMVYAHEGRGVRLWRLVERGVCNAVGGRRTLGMHDARDRAQRAVELPDQSIHAGTINETGAEAPVSPAVRLLLRSGEPC